ncbi:hypothetical protein K3495_g11407 [Podosphaera aphanis]|nr:hypothetical protein K3495_g11407 [Podosphaera aphanis]
MSRDELLVLGKTLTDLLDKNYIRASSSPAGAPVLFVKKPGGGLRFCVDYRALNSISKADRYPLPLIKETLARLSKAKWFTKLDVRATFHKLRIKEVMPFGLNGAPASFQRYVNETLRDHPDDFCSAYVDDILINTDGDLAEHDKHVNVKKTKYLGFIISAEGLTSSVRMDPAKVRAISEWEPPTTVKTLRSFLGFAKFYRGFIDGFSRISAPLKSLTGKGAPWRWESEQKRRSKH